MAGLPEVKEDVAMLDAHTMEAGGAGGVGAEVAEGVAIPVSEGVKGNPAVGGAGGGQGGKKGKKKGKK
jgi:hypothetical protein